jgi:hypothetical protein
MAEIDTLHSVFEVQVLVEGAWRIRSVKDDEDSAISEARRLSNVQMREVRVVEDQFDENRKRVRTRTVFALAHQGGPAAPAPARRTLAARVMRLTGRSAAEIERHNEEMRERRLERSRRLKALLDVENEWSGWLLKLTFQACAFGAVVVLWLIVARYLWQGD